MPRVLITGARAPAALDLARAFRAAGWTVTLADSVRAFSAMFARPRFAMASFPPPRSAFASFRERIASLAAAVDLVVPTCEEVFWLAAAAGRDGWSDKLFAPDLAVLRRLHSKLCFPSLARAAGVDAPATQALSSRRDVERLADRLDALVLKPEFSRFGSHAFVSPSAAQSRSILPTPAARWAAQERIHGEELCVWSAIRDGRISASVVYRPLLRHKRSASYAFEVVDRPAVAAAAGLIARAVGGSGQLSYDVIVTPEGRVAPLECNPRTVSGIHLFDASATLVGAFIGEGAIESPRPGTIRYLAPAMVVMGLPAAVAGRSIRRFREICRAGKDVIGRRGDRGPAGGVVLDAARFALLGLARRNSPTGQTTDDIEWNGEEIG